MAASNLGEASPKPSPRLKPLYRHGSAVGGRRRYAHRGFAAIVLAASNPGEVSPKPLRI